MLKLLKLQGLRVVFMLLLSFAVTRVYFHAGFPYTHDGENHLARFANYALAIREGQFPPRFAPNLLNHYGYPVFNYNYPLANILSVPGAVVKLNYELTFKLLAFGAVLLGIWGAGYWLKWLGLDEKTQWFGMAIYASSTYLFSTIAFRGNIGEVWAFGLLPWLFAGVEVAGQRQVKPFMQFWLMILFTAFLLSHNVTVLFGVPIVLMYAVTRLQLNKTAWLKLLSWLGVAVGGSLWFWLPAVLEKSLIVVDQGNVNTQFIAHFPVLAQLLFSPLSFGFSYLGRIDSLYLGLGTILVVCLGVSGLLLLKLKVAKTLPTPELSKFGWLWWLCVGLGLFQLSATQPLWQLAAPIARYIQFPWRLTLFFQVLMVPVAAWLFAKISRTWQLVLVMMVVVQWIIFFRTQPVDYFHRQKIDYEFFTQTTSTNNENLARTFTYQNIGEWQPQPVILNGKAEVEVQQWRGSRRQYRIEVIEPVTVIEPTMNFSGWQTLTNGQKLNYIDSPEIGGRVAYTLPTGSYEIRSEFTQWTWPRVIGNTVSVVTVLGLLSWLLLKLRKFK